MRTPELSELTHLTPEGAVRLHLDGRNNRALRWVFALTAPTAAITGIASASTGSWITAATWWTVLALVLTALFARNSAWFEKYARQVLLTVLAAVVLAAIWTFPEPEASFTFAGFLFPIALLVFRLRPVEHVALGGGLLACAAWFATRPEVFTSAAAVWIAITMATLVGLTSLAIGSSRTRRAEATFLAAWHAEVGREREQRRMRTEIHDAREIQMSMLPAENPGLPWLDFCAVSLPASEVGGDYYDFFPLGPERIAVVIGDVAGHGVASGLVLSGVRSGLFLLRGELDRPVHVLRRLSEMLRATAPSRMLVTLQIAILDWSTRVLTIASAGHPPLLHVSAGTVRSFGGGSLPLGTGLEAHYQEEQRTLHAGDCLILCTDGILELNNARGVPMGEAQLAEEAARASHAGSARQIRDSILNGISRYKGDVEATDDMTLVVLKMDSLLGADG
jgi:hypothetical protein